MPTVVVDGNSGLSTFAFGMTNNNKCDSNQNTNNILNNNVENIQNVNTRSVFDFGSNPTF